jgi:hypothetical protein
MILQTLETEKSIRVLKGEHLSDTTSEDSALEKCTRGRRHSFAKGLNTFNSIPHPSNGTWGRR